MRHPYEKFVRIELVSIISAFVIGIIALIKGFPILIFICFFLVAISLCAEAIILWFTYQKVDGGKQLIRAMIIFLLTTFLIFTW
jgi:type III secretory pathway component EscV